mmetsp:Transcript_15770/g.66446  ORF Transcript_15770/g.66446 Transcript_15770/m.66446 type:complete len:168 (-) Transcript_15770:667-1170(-)
MGAEPVHAPLAAPNVADIAAPATKQTDMDSPFNRGGTPSTSAAVSTACALAETARDPPAARMPNLEGVSSEVVVSDDSTANGVSEVKQEDPTPPPAVPASATEQGDTTNAPETKTAPVVATDTAKEGAYAAATQGLFLKPAASSRTKGAEIAFPRQTRLFDARVRGR